MCARRWPDVVRFELGEVVGEEEERQSDNRRCDAINLFLVNRVGSRLDWKSSERRRDEMVGSQACSFSAFASVTSGVLAAVPMTRCGLLADVVPVDAAKSQACLTRVISTHARLTPHQIFSSSR